MREVAIVAVWSSKYHSVWRDLDRHEGFFAGIDVRESMHLIIERGHALDETLLDA